MIEHVVRLGPSPCRTISSAGILHQIGHAPKARPASDFATSSHVAVVEVGHDLDAALPRADAVMMLRIQRERGASRAIGTDYRTSYGLTRDRANRLGEGVPILHPGPSNRGVEIDDEVHDDPDRSLIRFQVAAGVAVRMAALERAIAEV